MRFIVCCLLPLCFFSNSFSQTKIKNTGTINIIYSPDHPANTFIPSQIIGAAVDGHEKGDIDHMLTPENIKAMKSVGLKPISYRLRTELAGEVWHWNPKGTWSESGKQQGYWVSDDKISSPINLSYGYKLPRRGNTIDQANNDGYSRLDDGDDKTFWKSNPYLDEYFTKESNALHPQWAIIDLGKLMDVNAIRIKWGNPYAVSFAVDYALDLGSDYFEPFRDGLWHFFSKGKFADQKGDDKILSISDTNVRARLIRISFSQSSKTTTQTSGDIRDRLGFAIREIEVGVINKKGIFKDEVKHSADHNKQSKAYVSSTDLWHRATDINYNTEQAGIDKFFACGITNDQPPMMPVGVLYDTPENMEAYLKYLVTKKYSVHELEMGEEPEGQLISPVDYSSLYYQWAKKLKAISPEIHLGGPGFATLAFSEDAINGFSQAKWTTQFLNYLKKKNSTDLFNFFTFEWYPFDETCMPTAPQLAQASQMLDVALKDVQKILPPDIPIYLTEYAYSAFSGKAEVEIEGALFYADILGKFLTLGGNKNFLYGYEPAYLEKEAEGCDYGNNLLFGLNDDGKIKYRTAAFYGMQMLLQKWLQPSNEKIEMYPASSDILNKENQELISAYPILHADKKWSIAVINKDPSQTKNISVNIFNSLQNKNSSLHFPVELIQYSGEQYQWVNKGIKGHPSRSLPPIKKIILKEEEIALPPYSLSIITEQ